MKPAEGYEPFTPSDSTALRAILRPADVLLVEGNNHISGVIKYLTQSSWSHSALYVGPMADAATPEGEPHVLIEAKIDEGVVSAPLSKYQHHHTRICRPVGLSEADCEKGLPLRLRTHWSRLRSQEHHRPDALSTPVASAAALARPDDRARLRRCEPHHLFFADCASVRRRALPDPAEDHARREADGASRNAEIRHSSLYAPRDFDISPYFMVVKPTLARGFNYKDMHWADLPHPAEVHTAQGTLTREIEGGMAEVA
jgi:hypothetical protein